MRVKSLGLGNGLHTISWVFRGKRPPRRTAGTVLNLPTGRESSSACTGEVKENYGRLLKTGAVKKKSPVDRRKKEKLFEHTRPREKKGMTRGRRVSVAGRFKGGEMRTGRSQKRAKEAPVKRERLQDQETGVGGEEEGVQCIHIVRSRKQKKKDNRKLRHVRCRGTVKQAAGELGGKWGGENPTRRVHPKKCP